jgi:hypothetical protein
MTQTWRKSSWSGGNGECVEVRGGRDAVRDSKNPAVVLPVGTLPMLVEQMKAGRFALPTS